MIRGIDISNHQGTIGWPAAASGDYQFALIKASEGTTFVDRFFVANWKQSKAAGLVRAAYHYAQVGNSPRADADHFLGVLGRVTVELGDLVALDLEEGDGNLADWALAWLRRVEAALGFKPLLYSYPHFMMNHGLTGRADLAEYGLWYASYGAHNVPQPAEAIPPPPSAWPVIAIWQDSSNGVVPGVAGPCDVNWFNGDSLDALRIYGKRAPAAVNPYWEQIGPGLAAVIRQRGDEPVGPERYSHDPDRTNPDGTPQNIESKVAGRQRRYIWDHDANRATVQSYEPLVLPG